MRDVTSALDEFTRSWFHYSVTIMGAGAAVHLVLDGIVSKLFAKIDSDRNTSLGGLIAVLSLGGLAFGIALGARDHLTFGTIVLVLVTALMISGVRYWSKAP